MDITEQCIRVSGPFEMAADQYVSAHSVSGCYPELATRHSADIPLFSKKWLPEDLT